MLTLAKRALIAVAGPIVGLALLMGAAHAQGNTTGLVIATCGSPPQAFNVGNPGPFTLGTDGKLCVNAAVSVSASITGFPGTSQTTGTPIAVTTGGVTGTLPAGTEVVAFNAGTTNTAYCKLGASASTSDVAIPPNSWFGFTVGAATQLTCITSTSTTTVNMVGGSGLPTGAGGGGGGSGSSGAVFGPTAAGSAAANPPVLMGGTIDGTSTGNVDNWKIASGVGSVNTAQVNGTTTLTNTGATGAGSQRITVAQDTATVAGSAPGTAGSASTNVFSIQGIASMTPVLVNPGTAGNFGVVAQGSTTSGQTGNLVQGAVTTAAPSYTTLQTAPLSLDTAGNLRVNVVAGGGSGGTSSSFGSTFPLTGTAIGLTNGTNMVAWSATSNYGTAPSAIAVPAVNASVTASALPTGAATSANQATNGATTAHTCSTGGFSELGCLGQIDDDVKGAVPALNATAYNTNSYTTGGTNPVNADLNGNLYANISKFGGTAVVTGTGTGGAGIPRVTVSSDSFPTTQAISGQINVTPTDCSTTITSGGTAQNIIAASSTLHGFTIANIDASAGSGEPLWMSFTTTAAASTPGSYPLAAPTATTFAGLSSYTTPVGFGTNHAVSIIGVTTGHKISCTQW